MKREKKSSKNKSAKKETKLSINSMEKKNYLKSKTLLKNFKKDSSLKAKSNKNKDNNIFVNERDFLTAKKGKQKKKQKKKKTVKKKEIIDIPFSKFKSKGTNATLGNIYFHYQQYVNIRYFFHYLKMKNKFDLNYMNPILEIYSIGNKIVTKDIPDLKFDNEFNIVIINLVTKKENHANIALVNNKINTIEFFEPHGYRKNKYSEIDNNKGIYRKKIKVLKEIFKPLLPNHSFIDVVSMHKKTSFQTELDPDEHTGFCVMWCILFVHYRLLNQDILLSRLIKYIVKNMTTIKLLKYSKFVEEIIKQKFDLIN